MIATHRPLPRQITICAGRLPEPQRQEFISLMQEAVRLMNFAWALRRSAWALYRRDARRDWPE